MTARTVFLVDAGTGNIRSVAHALAEVGADVKMAANPEQLKPGRVILPGVGAFGGFMSGLKDRGLSDPLLRAAASGNPLLGICVGMQAFFQQSDEFGSFGGLGLLPGRVVRFSEQQGYKIPHTGWNQLWQQGAGTPILNGLQPGSYVYFNHSYYCQPEKGDLAAFTDYALNFASVVQHGNCFGVQFHPEKSQRAGLRILQNFLEL